MCMRIISRECPRPKIAEEDIHVQKVLSLVEFDVGKGYYSPYMKHFSYTVDGTYAERSVLGVPIEVDDSEAFRILSKISQMEKDRLGNTVYNIYEGLHSVGKIINIDGYWCSADYWKSHERDFVLEKHDNHRLFDAIIPKLSLYYVNHCGEYVSNKLLITGEHKEE